MSNIATRMFLGHVHLHVISRQLHFVVFTLIVAGIILILFWGYEVQRSFTIVFFMVWASWLQMHLVSCIVVDCLHVFDLSGQWGNIVR